MYEVRKGVANAKRGVGSNQYADKASNATIEEVENIRSLSSAVGMTPALSSSSWMAYSQLESAYEDFPAPTPICIPRQRSLC